MFLLLSWQSSKKNGQNNKKVLLFPLYILFFSLLTLLFPNCKSKANWHTSTLLYFDTVCEIKLFCNSLQFESAQEKLKKTFKEVEKYFSPESKDYSSPVILELYKKAHKVYISTGGCFDITVAPLSFIWGFHNHSRHIPDPDQIRAILKNIGMNKIGQKEKKLIVPEGMSLDWGAIAKGYGIDRASRELIKIGIKRGFINAGGDLYCWGNNPNNQYWKIGIKHPRGKGILGVLSISNTGTATTGDYQRFFIKNKKRYHHVFDPKTGYPARGKQSVTVIGPETLLCDALSTALFVSKTPEKILKKYPDYGAVIVDSKGKIRWSGKKYSFSLLK
ncbi:MAG: FAD:protein FMN transferase [Candidatus Aminicenantaceae bacterium]